VDLLRLLDLDQRRHQDEVIGPDRPGSQQLSEYFFW
jgi:hypothetical protein